MTTVPVNTGRMVAVDRVDRADTWVERSRTPWSAIMMGAVTAIGLQLIFTALGIALGVTLTDAADATAQDADAVSTTAFIWWLVTGTISLFVGGAVVGRWLGVVHQVTVCITAATMWSVVAIFGFLVVWSGAGMTLSAAGPFAIASQEYAEIGRFEDGRVDANRIGANRVIGSGEAAIAGETQSDAMARAYAERAQDALQTASWWSVIGLILGVIAAWSGAEMGARVLKRNQAAVA